MVFFTQLGGYGTLKPLRNDPLTHQQRRLDIPSPDHPSQRPPPRSSQSHSSGLGGKGRQHWSNEPHIADRRSPYLARDSRCVLRRHSRCHPLHCRDDRCRFTFCVGHGMEEC